MFQQTKILDVVEVDLKYIFSKATNIINKSNIAWTINYLKIEKNKNFTISSFTINVLNYFLV